MKFEGMAVAMMMAVFWDVLLYGLVEDSAFQRMLLSLASG